MQVVYFHNPQYERRMQERKRIEDVSKGTGGIEMVQLLAPIMQLHPEILVRHEEEDISSSDRKSWIWLIMGRIIYLCSPWNEEEGSRLFYHHMNLAVLLALYRKQVSNK